MNSVRTALDVFPGALYSGPLTTQYQTLCVKEKFNNETSFGHLPRLLNLTCYKKGHEKKTAFE